MGHIAVLALFILIVLTERYNKCIVHFGYFSLTNYMLRHGSMILGLNHDHLHD